jgi:hypothetical protein
MNNCSYVKVKIKKIEDRKERIRFGYNRLPAVNACNSISMKQSTRNI